ncbi:hypothetical protein EDD37DRAFT_407554 [Exophiala viscosa]|uniref:Phospholipase D n=1 Tax=Exophiala viscosa TaxID=2486360 RepID=A0AAN6E0H5_9EURO|nr:hypothetical protein EDD36DRAFT_164499 [Exophiala viscosa]KAI1624314.1 hypothetical protein EDD37DRAFT_407554 [Exophiala viscosa]
MVSFAPLIRGLSAASSLLTSPLNDAATLILGTSQQALIQPVLPPTLDLNVVSNLTTDTTSTSDELAVPNPPMPFYLIAHRVSTVQGVQDALSHGANAIEMDLTAYNSGWYVDHDGIWLTRGGSARQMFQAIADARQAGKTITFVWLDIKNPDYCDPNKPMTEPCSIDTLQDLAREILQPYGVRVLYGFYGGSNIGPAFKRVIASLNDYEAIDLESLAATVQQAFSAAGLSQSAKGIMSYGNFILGYQFGNCEEESYYTCTELRQAVESRHFGKVFSWTLEAGQSWYLDKLMGEASVDGLIYGFKAAPYYDHPDTRSAAQDIFSWINDHSDRRYVATQDDHPW